MGDGRNVREAREGVESESGGGKGTVWWVETSGGGGGMVLAEGGRVKVGEESGWKVGSPRAWIVAADSIPWACVHDGGVLIINYCVEWMCRAVSRLKCA